MSKEISLPAVPATNSIMLTELLRVLNVPRSVLASDEQISYAWNGLPRQLQLVPVAYRNELIARMCVAVQAGLFDSALNYIWNVCVMALRDKVRHFGLTAISQIERKEFDETDLVELRDAELLDLCLNLNLITEEGFFYLSQNRELRNNFSAAHPNIGFINDTELIAFLSRVTQFALGGLTNPRGVDLQALIHSIQKARFASEQIDYWSGRIEGTHEAQRQTIFSTIHGICCDGSVKEYARLNSLDLSRTLSHLLTPKIESALIDKHSEYLAKGDSERTAASRNFFTELARLGLLAEPERHSIITVHCKRLMSAHQAYDNFHNEPPFAQQLCLIALQAEVPSTAKHEYVNTVTSCFIGNGYGVSTGAFQFYEQMVRAFSSKEIQYFFAAAIDSKGVVGRRIMHSRDCARNFAKAVSLLDAQSIPTTYQMVYSEWLSRL